MTTHATIAPGDVPVKEVTWRWALAEFGLGLGGDESLSAATVKQVWRGRRESEQVIAQLGISNPTASRRGFREVVTFLAGNAGLHPDLADALLL